VPVDVHAAGIIDQDVTPKSLDSSVRYLARLILRKIAVGILPPRRGDHHAVFCLVLRPRRD
jgi:hypothetical protein